MAGKAVVVWAKIFKGDLLFGVPPWDAWGLFFRALATPFPQAQGIASWADKIRGQNEPTMENTAFKTPSRRQLGALRDLIFNGTWVHYSFRHLSSPQL